MGDIVGSWVVDIDVGGVGDFLGGFGNDGFVNIYCVL